MKREAHSVIFDSESGASPMGFFEKLLNLAGVEIGPRPPIEFKPSAYEELGKVVDQLIKQETVIVDYSLLDDLSATRFHDYLMGAVDALDLDFDMHCHVNGSAIIAYGNSDAIDRYFPRYLEKQRQSNIVPFPSYDRA